MEEYEEGEEETGQGGDAGDLKEWMGLEVEGADMH